MEHKIVFISAATYDLQVHQAAIRDAMQSVTHWRCLFSTYESYSFAHDETIRQIQTCDLFVGVLGHCYRPILSQSQKSIAETEYRWAEDAKRERLIFVALDDFPVPANLREPDEMWLQLQGFRSYAKVANHCLPFSSPEDLAHKVLLALSNWERSYWHQVLQGQISTGGSGIFRDKDTDSLKNYIKEAISDMEDKLMSKPRDEYNITVHGPAGIAGPVRGDRVSVVQEMNEISSSIDMEALTNELEALNKRLQQEASQPEHYHTIGEIASAKAEAQAGNRSKVFEHLSKVGQWALDVATKIGVSVAIAAIKESLGVK